MDAYEKKYRARMTELARTFPTFALGTGRGGDPGVAPFDAEVLLASLGAWSSGEKHTAFFLLAVWNSEFDHLFNVNSALAAWDTAHRQAFLNWAKDPWWA